MFHTWINSGSRIGVTTIHFLIYRQNQKKAEYEVTCVDPNSTASNDFLLNCI